MNVKPLASFVLHGKKRVELLLLPFYKETPFQLEVYDGVVSCVYRYADRAEAKSRFIKEMNDLIPCL